MRRAATLRTIDYAARRTPSGVFEPIPVSGACTHADRPSALADARRPLFPAAIEPTATVGTVLGVRVFDLTRILIGLVGARILAEHGAGVLMVTAAHLPQVPDHVRDTGHGKRSCLLYFRKERRRGALRRFGARG